MSKQQREENYLVVAQRIQLDTEKYVEKYQFMTRAHVHNIPSR